MENIFTILLLSAPKCQANILVSSNYMMGLDTKYLWKLVYLRDYMTNRTLRGFYNDNALLGSMKNSSQMTKYLQRPSLMHTAKQLSINSGFYNMPFDFAVNFINITSLNIFNMCAPIIPTELFSLINLEVLSICNAELLYLPTEIGQLVNVNRLYLTQGDLTVLPSEIGTLRKLTYLEFQYNHIISMPKEIGHLIILEAMVGHNNQIIINPSELGKCQWIKYMNLCNVWDQCSRCEY